ncbi:hypothetical protein MKY34_03295 [Sporosarcina sp. FSL K6-1522]|uniref:hypothetical protein n=1 Tax=Sporosarcina sp. FSL K6-1522 TaxID=2921554 RepID=UPI003159B816
MKKRIVTTAFLLIFGFAYQHDVQAKVIWDKSEIVERQSGKMSFIKDVKIYKPMADGTFTSMIAKKNNFFRVYDIEKYNGKVYYWMSSGYRVEATNLVNFKAVPMEIRAAFFDNPGYVIANHAGFQFPNEFPGSYFSYGSQIQIRTSANPSGYDHQLVSFDKEYLVVSRQSRQGEIQISEQGRIHGSDIKVVSQQKFREGIYALKSDVVLRHSPLSNATTNTNLKANAQVSVPTGTLIVNGYVYAYFESVSNYGYVPVSYLTTTNNY